MKLAYCPVSVLDSGIRPQSVLLYMKLLMAVAESGGSVTTSQTELARMIGGRIGKMAQPYIAELEDRGYLTVTRPEHGEHTYTPTQLTE